ncbi:MAG: CHAP domain-containing protein [Ruminococcus sp.]|nr:CHAP domain-containing protein [Ruminococcus sp.]
MMNNKIISSINAVFITILVWITFMSLPMQSVKATQTRKDNFNKSYSLTGNGPTDMLSIAFAQVGKTGNDLGYSEAWCANFVSDCADLAGQSQAIPRHGAVSNLRDLVISAGGSYVTSPIPGDLVIWKNSISHVEIVSKVENGVVYSIGGNNGGTGNPKTNRVAGERRVTSIGTVTCYVRPNYSDPIPKLVTPTINTDKSYYVVGETVNISWAASP